MSEFDEESELDNVNLVTVYGEDYNNKELVEYSKREKAKNVQSLFITSYF